MAPAGPSRGRPEPGPVASQRKARERERAVRGKRREGLDVQCALPGEVPIFAAAACFAG